VAEDCTRCPELQARLYGVAGGLRGLAAFIDAELVEPTMPWKQLIPLIAIRVENAADHASGRY